MWCLVVYIVFVSIRAIYQFHIYNTFYKYIPHSKSAQKVLSNRKKSATNKQIMRCEQLRKPTDIRLYANVL